jgi:hypothetical protein
MTPAQTLSKSEFAGRVGLSRARVSQLLTEGKISGDALEGEGRSARIVVDRALQQLKINLDVAQHAGMNGKAQLGKGAPALRAAAPDDDETSQIRAEKLRQAQLTTIRMQRDEQEASRRYVLAEELEVRVSGAASRLLQMVEASLPALAARLSAACPGVDTRTATHELRLAFREVRERIAGEVEAEAKAMPETVADPIASPIEGSA